MNALRAILVLALVVHPLLLRALPCGPLVAPESTPACCEGACLCEGGCGCAMGAPTVPAAPVPDPATPPGGVDLRASLPAAPPVVVGAIPSPPPAPPAAADDAKPHACCDSVNALLCIWTT